MRGAGAVIQPIALGMVLGVLAHVGPAFLRHVFQLLDGGGPPVVPDTPDHLWRAKPDSESEYRHPSWEALQRAMDKTMCVERER